MTKWLQLPVTFLLLKAASPVKKNWLIRETDRITGTWSISQQPAPCVKDFEAERHPLSISFRSSLHQEEGGEVEIEKGEKHTQNGERRKMTERFKNSSVLEKMGKIAHKKQRLTWLSSVTGYVLHLLWCCIFAS